MADEAARAGPPGGAGFGFVMGGGEIAELFESLMTFEKGLAFADERLKFDRADFGAVLLLRRTLLPVLVLVELTVRLRGEFVEKLGERPKDGVNSGID